MLVSSCVNELQNLCFDPQPGWWQWVRVYCSLAWRMPSDSVWLCLNPSQKKILTLVPQFRNNETLTLSYSLPLSPQWYVLKCDVWFVARKLFFISFFKIEIWQHPAKHSLLKHNSSPFVKIVGTPTGVVTGGKNGCVQESFFFLRS